MQYVWDPAKAASNLKKHGVSFAEAVGVLENPASQHDLDASRDEARLNVTGWSLHARLLFVVCVEIDGDVLRIISARKATLAEMKTYDEQS